ncbi:hypothetical protein HPB50_006964 [Hyalomma asiaticum]|uniref:Uncharacterized protein n=1 Tax=Hyalomma asiaticum TaxID=266040 RepID=A0ACB7TDA8_HYAAI|nr:hypothetical protein HPB50_006964 [Hyalomma asiaticum]
MRQREGTCRCYGENSDNIGEMFIYGILAYMGHTHRRQSSFIVSAAGDSPILTLEPQASIAPRFQDVRLERLSQI